MAGSHYLLTPATPAWTLQNTRRDKRSANAPSKSTATHPGRLRQSHIHQIGFGCLACPAKEACVTNEVTVNTFQRRVGMLHGLTSNPLKWRESGRGQFSAVQCMQGHARPTMTDETSGKCVNGFFCVLSLSVSSAARSSQFSSPTSF